MISVVHSLPFWLPLTSTWLHNLVRHLPRERVESHVVCEWTENLDQFAIDGVHSFSAAPSWRRLWDKGLRRLHLRRHLGFLVSTARHVRAGIIHSHWGDAAWRDLGATRALGARHVVTFYGKDVNYLPRAYPVWRSRYRELFDGIDAVLCEGPHMARCIVALGCREQTVRVHRIGIEVDKIRFAPRVRRPGEPLRVLIAASFREKKGIPHALEALGRVQASGTEVEIAIIGDASGDPRSRPEKERILRTIEAQGLGPKTRLLGYQPHRVFFDEAYRHHVFLSPSLTASDGDTEGGAPVSILEMAATGMPVVSTRHCDIPSIVLDGESGLLADERDVEGLSDRLRWLAENPGRWEAMGVAARRLVETEHDVRRQAERLADLYEQLAATSRVRLGGKGSA